MKMYKYILAVIIILFVSCNRGRNSEVLKSAFFSGKSPEEVYEKISDISEPVYDVAILLDTTVVDVKTKLDSLYNNGYAYNKVSSANLEKAEVKSHLITVDGLNFKLLYTNLFDTYETVLKMVDDGAVIVNDVADEPIRDLPINNTRTIKFGGGGVINGMKPNEVLALMKIAPQFSFPPDLKLYWRQFQHKGIDLFYVENKEDHEVAFRGGFKTLVGAPELWNPVTKEQFAIEDYWQIKGTVTLDVKLSPGQALLYVFGTNADRDEMKEYTL